jgi:hypothetical protein
MTPRVLRALLAIAVLAVGAGAEEPAPPPPPAPPPAPAPQDYLRVRESEEGVLFLDVATRVFAPASGEGPRIHLVSAVHVADGKFYADAQERLDRCDFVLFEGVRAAGAVAIAADAGPEVRRRATTGRLEILKEAAAEARADLGAFPADLEALLAAAGGKRGTHLRGILADGWGRPIRYVVHAEPERLELASDGPDGKPGTADAPGDDLRAWSIPPAKRAAGKPAPATRKGIQQELADALGLVYQGDAIDTSRPRWRSSDMGIDELKERLDAAGADPSQLFKLLDGSSFDARMARAFLTVAGKTPKFAAMMKMIVVEALGSSAGDVGGLPGGSEAGTKAMMRVIIEDRNEVVLADLKRVLAGTSPPKVVAVFYGAAHMKDLERRIVEGIGYRPGESTWAEAIRVDPKDAGYTPEGARSMRKFLRDLIRKQSAGR